MPFLANRVVDSTHEISLVSMRPFGEDPVMAPDLSESYLSGYVAPGWGLTGYALGTAFSLALLLLGFYCLLERKDPCLGPWFIFCGSLALAHWWLRFQRTIIWFEWTGDSLRYRRACRSAICEVSVSEINKLQPLVRGRQRCPYGFQILCRDGNKLYVDYDIGGYSVLLERALYARLGASHNRS
jgi:hypothetical protein